MERLLQILDLLYTYRGDAQHSFDLRGPRSTWADTVSTAQIFAILFARAHFYSSDAIAPAATRTPRSTDEIAALVNLDISAGTQEIAIHRRLVCLSELVAVLPTSAPEFNWAQVRLSIHASSG